MGGDGGFYGPMGYSVLWTVVAVALLVLVAAWYVVVWRRTRPAPPPAPVPPLPPAWRLAQLQGESLHRIDEVVRLVHAGELSQRRGHQELSVVVREFVQEASGVDAPTMTLTDLGRSGNRRLDPVTDVVLRLYPVEFGPDRPASVSDAAEVARRVVQRWS